MANEHLDPKVLGQLLLMQSLINNLPDEKSIFSFVCKGLPDIPGIAKVEFINSKTKPFEESSSQIRYPVALGKSLFGYLLVSFSDLQLFKPYEDYLKNFIFMIAIILEERTQRQINEQNKALLEQRILERTRELIEEKENLQESQRRFTDLMKNIQLLSVMLDVKGNIIFCNKYLLTLTKYTIEELIGKNWFDIFVEKDKVEEEKKNFLQTMKGEKALENYENDIITKDGRKLLIWWNNTLLRDARRKITGSARIGENITERKQAEEALITKNLEYKYLNDEYSALNEELTESLENLKKINAQLEIAKERAEESDRLKTAFLQNMSHEIRTPMNAIMGFSNLLVKQFNNKEKLQRYSDIINTRCNDLLDIINDILDISKIESGQLTINVEECNLDMLFVELTDFFLEYRKRIGKEHIKFSLQKHESVQKNLFHTDKVKLKQILINLISNALKFTDSGSVEGTCILTDEYIRFSIADTGIGIAPDKHKFIFERFTQVQNPIRNSGGTGLGLSIVKALVHLLGGEITLQSEPGKGSIFSFFIPFKASQK